MLSWKLAWRSFRRHRRRSIITAAGISLGLTMMIVFVGIGDDGHARMAEIGIRFGSGHVVVQGKGYQREQTIDFLIEDPTAITEVARQVANVQNVVSRVRASGLLSSGEASSAVLVAGVNPKVEPLVSTSASDAKRVEGHYLRPADQLGFANQPGDIYIGVELARTLSLQLEDRVVLTVSPRGGGKPAAAAFLVRGIFKTGLDELDGFYVEIDIAQAQQLLELGKGVTQVALLLDDLGDTAAATAAMQTALHKRGDLEILPWQEALAELYEAIVLDDGSIYLMMAIIFVIVAIGIFNTILMSVVERTREFGVMLAVGTSTRLLFRAVMAEAFILAIVAAAIGLVLGLSIHLWLADTGLDIAALYGEDFEMAGIVFDGRIYSRLSAFVVTKWTLMVIGIVLASALYPALRTTQLRPVEAMRHV